MIVHDIFSVGTKRRLKEFLICVRVGSMKKRKIIISAGRRPWPHELRVANILALAGHVVEFLEEWNLKTVDINLI